METIATPWVWVGFIVFVLAMLALDLGVFHRKSQSPCKLDTRFSLGVIVTVLAVSGCGLVGAAEKGGPSPIPVVNPSE